MKFKKDIKGLPIREFDVVVAGDIAPGLRSGIESQIIRMGAEGTGSSKNTLPAGFTEGIKQLGSGLITTTVHDNYLKNICRGVKKLLLPERVLP
ncbi:MAG: hypothetical protein NTY95_16295 [Bacteroidia bacterium]|nr:hypothetical protein [Bacteroidia bacterium]